MSSAKRITQMLWAAAALMLTIGIVHLLNDAHSEECIYNKIPSFDEKGGGEETNNASNASQAQSSIASTSVHPGEVSKGATGNTNDIRWSMEEHMRLAEANWAKTVKQRHEMIKTDYGDVKDMQLFPAVNEETYRGHPYSIWDFTPASYSCPHEMERVGRMGDGGKWVCGMSRYENRTCTLYSFGVRDESSFENEMLTRTKCEVFAYDFSVVDFGEQLEPSNRPRAHFTQAGIGKTDTARDPPFYSISDLMKMNGHDYIDILKMDIEYAEFESMDGLSEAFAQAEGHELPVGQLMIEIHNFQNMMTAEKYLTWWEGLEARGLRPTWTEPNLLAVTINVSGDRFPILAEYTMVNVQDKRNVLFAVPRVGENPH